MQLQRKRVSKYSMVYISVRKVRHLRHRPNINYSISSVPMQWVCLQCRIKVFGISVITDLGVEGKIVEVTHEEVQKAADAAQPKMTEIMRELINRA